MSATPHHPALGVAHFLFLISLFSLEGCEGQVGPCAGQDCPKVPGCENDATVVCDQDHVCIERVCEGVGWICGVDELGAYVWMRSRAPCDDKNACTSGDLCVAGQCMGTPLECKSPPQKACTDATTLTTYDSGGTCTAGKCVYSSSKVTCSQGCKGGQCVGDPCKGIKCDNPPGPCHKKPGECKNGTCVYVLNPVGTSCDTKDSCNTSGTCDSAGKCSGTPVDCARSHTSGGTCVQGVCQGYKCDSGWGNCNSSWSDGCETNLTSSSHCGGCGKKCGSVANGSPSCSGGKCVVRCNSPYQDCDKSYSNGCEIPVGKANSCNSSGLASFSGQTPPCGTPYCGSSTKSKVKNFGTWYCISCTHCNKMSDGKYAWCLTANSKFSSDRCTTCCNVSSYPQVCK